jgi:REP element-mobilizing transposase RayT
MGTQVSHLRQPQAERMGTQVSHLRQPQAERMGTQVSHLRQPQAERLRTKKRLLEQLQQYRQWLLQITILDPACGSGAFLNAALQFLMAEHHLIDEMEAKVTGSAIVFQDVENSILEHNLYGVDINEESVEIAKLSLWLRTAKPHRKLNSLNRNIKCGNSLISDPAIAGEKAFDWQKEFPQVFGTQVSHLRNNEQQTADDSPRYASVPLAKTVGNTLAKTAGATPAYHCRKYLPHIENQPLQFITFRLYDSLPKEVIETLKAYRDLLSGTQVSHLRPSVSAGETPAYQAPAGETPAYQYQKMLELLDRYEDAGYGQCFLRDKRIATIVRNALFYFDGERYELIQWCIMPNHVHVLIKVRPGVSLSTILHSWRTFTAHEANKILGRTGQFWMHEYFDRYIRDARHFESTVNYIRNNPVKAGLVSEPEQWPWVGDGTQVSHLRNNEQQTADDSPRYTSVPLATTAGETLVTPAGETPAYQTPAGETPAYQGGIRCGYRQPAVCAATEYGGHERRLCPVRL